MPRNNNYLGTDRGSLFRTLAHFGAVLLDQVPEPQHETFLCWKFSSNEWKSRQQINQIHYAWPRASFDSHGHVFLNPMYSRSSRYKTWLAPG